MLNRSQQMSADPEEIQYETAHRHDALRVSETLEPPHLSLALPRRLMRHLGAVVRILIRTVDHRRHHCAVRGRVTEQAKGKVVDKRADVWAFGAVLFEMVTGARPFAGDDMSETLARVIDREPDWAALPDNVPPVLNNFLRRCLQKNPKQRVHDIADVRLAMEGAFETTVSAAAAPALWTPDSARVVFQSSRDGGGVFWKAADGTGQVARLKDGLARPYAWAADGRLIFEEAQDIAVLTMEGERTVEMLLDAEYGEHDPALSPDGRWLAFLSFESGGHIHVRPFPNMSQAHS